MTENKILEKNDNRKNHVQINELNKLRTFEMPFFLPKKMALKNDRN